MLWASYLLRPGLTLDCDRHQECWTCFRRAAVFSSFHPRSRIPNYSPQAILTKSLQVNDECLCISLQVLGIVRSIPFPPSPVKLLCWTFFMRLQSECPLCRNHKHGSDFMKKVQELRVYMFVFAPVRILGLSKFPQGASVNLWVSILEFQSRIHASHGWLLRSVTQSQRPLPIFPLILLTSFSSLSAWPGLDHFSWAVFHKLLSTSRLTSLHSWELLQSRLWMALPSLQCRKLSCGKGLDKEALSISPKAQSLFPSSFPSLLPSNFFFSFSPTDKILTTERNPAILTPGQEFS